MATIVPEGEEKEEDQYDDDDDDEEDIEEGRQPEIWIQLV